MSQEELYKLRRKNMKQHLNFGDIKILAEKLLSEYPDISKSNLKDFANYLAQVLSLQSNRPFREDLARKIETVWPPLQNGDLDLTKSEMIHRLYLESNPIEDMDNEDYENEEAGRLKEKAIIPDIARDALKWRLYEKFIQRNIEIVIEEDVRFTIDNEDFNADLIVKDKNTKNKLAVAVIDMPLSRLEALVQKSRLLKLMISARVEVGVIASYKDTKLDVFWEGLE